MILRLHLTTLLRRLWLQTNLYCADSGFKRISTSQTASKLRHLLKMAAAILRCFGLASVFYSGWKFFFSFFFKWKEVEMRRPSFLQSMTGVFKPVLEAPLPCTFCMSHSSNTPDSTHQLISRDCKTWAVSQYQVRKVRTCVLGSSDFASSTRECELPRTGGHKSGNSANGTAVYLITSVSSPNTVLHNTTKYNIKHHCLSLFSCKHINSRKNVS